jgi:hypothetical protein
MKERKKEKEHESSQLRVDTSFTFHGKEDTRIT